MKQIVLKLAALFCMTAALGQIAHANNCSLQLVKKSNSIELLSQLEYLQVPRFTAGEILRSLFTQGRIEHTEVDYGGHIVASKDQCRQEALKLVEQGETGVSHLNIDLSSWFHANGKLTLNMTVQKGISWTYDDSNVIDSSGFEMSQSQ